MLDVEKIRGDFPIFSRPSGGKQLVYLDSAATSQKPRQVTDAMARFHNECNANVHRGIYEISEEATELYEGARAKVAKFINAKPAQTIFTRNATEAINLVAHAYGSTLQEGGTIVLTEMEHHSNIVPWQLLAERKKMKLEFVPVDSATGEIDGDAFSAAMEKTPALAAFTQASNVLGTITDAAGLARQAHDAGAAVLLDGAQGVPHLQTDFARLDCDFLAFSGHKMLAPSGIGVLCAKEEILERMPPFLGGGDMIREVTKEKSTWNDLPYKFEAGTPNAVGTIGLGAAIEYINGLGMRAIREHEIKTTAFALEALAQTPQVTAYGPTDAGKKTGVVAFNAEGVHPHDMASILDGEGIAIRAGHHCAMPLMERLGITSSARASFYVYTTEAEIELLAAGIKKALSVFA